MPDAPQSNEPVKEIFDELFTLLEDLEVRNEAIAELLKAEGIATEEKLRPYLEQAGNAASVRWRAVRVRMEHLFTPIPSAVREAKKETESYQQKAVTQREEQESKKPQQQGAGQSESKDKNAVQNEATDKSKDPPAKAETGASKSQSAKPGEDAVSAGDESENRESASEESQKLTGASVGPGAAKAAATDTKSKAEGKGAGG